MTTINDVEQHFLEYYGDFHHRYARDGKFTSSARTTFYDLNNYYGIGMNFLRFAAANHREMSTFELTTGFTRIRELYNHFEIKADVFDIAAWEEILAPMMNQFLFRFIFAQYQYSLIFPRSIRYFTMKIKQAQDQLKFYENQMYNTGFGKVELLKYLHSLEITHAEIENYQNIIKNKLRWKSDIFQNRLTIFYKYHFQMELIAEGVFD
jgi:hypothetical protein